MGTASTASAAVAMIAAMITPALLILASASLVATVLVRMARVVDRARVLAAFQHSALSGAARGLDVQVVVDACGGLSARTEDAAFRRLAQAGVVTASVASMAGQLASDFTQSKAGQAIGILYEMASG